MLPNIRFRAVCCDLMTAPFKIDEQMVTAAVIIRDAGFAGDELADPRLNQYTVRS